MTRSESDGHSSGMEARIRVCSRRRLAVLLALAAALALSGAGRAATFSVLTYNVAGLPLGLSSSSPEVNTVQISPRLNAFDLVAVQEDFGFHDELVSAITHPYRSVKDLRDVPEVIALAEQIGLPAPQLGDGLNTFSRAPFGGFERIPWSDCFGFFDSGSDCLAPKGFSFARVEIVPGGFVDVYDLHADAGGDDGSLAARRANLRQLAEAIVTGSAGNAVIVLGDFNSRYTRAGDILPEFAGTTGLTDVWIELARGGDVPEVGAPLQAGCAISFTDAECERVDKIFYRSGDQVLLEAIDHVVLEDWVDAGGAQLSDHEPVSALFRLTLVPEPATGLLLIAGLASLGSGGAFRPARRAGSPRRR